MEAWMKSSSVTSTSGKTLIKPSWHRGNTDQHTLPKISEGSAPLPSHLRFQDQTEIDTFLNWHQVEAHQKHCPPFNILTIQGWMKWWPLVADKQTGLRNLSKLIYNSLISYLNLWCNIAAWCEVFSVYSHCCTCFLCIYHECTLMHFSLTFLNSRSCRIFETCVPNITCLWQESEFLCTEYTNVLLTKLSRSFLIDLMKNSPLKLQKQSKEVF